MNATSDTADAHVQILLDEVIAAAWDLAKGGRWRRAASLLDATTTHDAKLGALLALSAAQVALESDSFSGTSAATERLSSAEQIFEDVDLDPDSRWDLAFLRLKRDYIEQIQTAGGFQLGPEGKDPNAIAGLRLRAQNLQESAANDVRRGWAEMYLGLIADNLFAQRHAAPHHYELALRAGEVGDDLLAREALRHLGDHDHDSGEHELALVRWQRATELGARAGAVPGTLSQQMLLAVLARDTGDQAGAKALAREVARWAAALGAVRIEKQAHYFLEGGDPTAPPETQS